MHKKFVIFFLFFLISLTDTSIAKSAYKQGMVASEHRLASQIGLNILKSGGNAIDAAVAVGYALAVVNPCCGNIGGGGFMTIHLADGKSLVLNFREKAPLHATKNMFLDKTGHIIPNKSTQGYLAVAVPGTVLGFETALKRYGTMTRQQVMAPAIKLAEQGYQVTAYEAKQFSKFANDFREQPNVAAIFLKNGKPYQAGNLLVQTNLANTLKLIAATGADSFYKGPIAQSIVSASTQHGGKLSLTDFATYSVDEVTPFVCNYRGYTILSSRPNAGGDTLCDILTTLQKVSLQKSRYGSLESIKIIVEAMRDGFLKRNNNFIHQSNFPRHELTDTTHYSIVDKFGNAVSVTYTLNGFFGARVIAGNTGFFLNNEMDDFTIKQGAPNTFNLIQSSKNTIYPGKRPLSSMAPTIILKNGRLFMVIGSPGGPRIITTVLLTLLNVIDYKMPLQTAVDAPRIHHQGIPNSIDAEPTALSLTLQDALKKLGYHLTILSTWGAIEAIEIDPISKELRGANDYRRPDGAALGY